MLTVRFYYSIGSRYSYLASTQIAALARDTGSVVEWCPLNSVALIALRDRDPFAGAPVSGQYDWTYREQDAARWAALYGVPFLEPRGRVAFDPGLVALAAVAGKRLGRVESYSRALFGALFAEPSVTAIDRAQCVRCAEACSIPPSRFEEALDDAATTRDLADTIDAAHRMGAFGVPTFVVGKEMFWGNDRLVLLRDFLARAGQRPL
jgi:2-hydroxychromene-2-carboxylate isomerase